MLTIYHNPRCRKSREAVTLLEEKKIPFEIVYYLDTPLNAIALKEILSKCNLVPSQIIRKQEAIWKTDYKGTDWSEKQLLQILVEHPKLIERPIVTGPTGGVLARPIGNLIAFLAE
ncbi:MAG: arsenate reductase (glutaredoxin) [Flavobacteriaceae bacterium]